MKLCAKYVDIGLENKLVMDWNNKIHFLPLDSDVEVGDWFTEDGTVVEKYEYKEMQAW